jgi:hypothetical protein
VFLVFFAVGGVGVLVRVGRDAVQRIGIAREAESGEAGVELCKRGIGCGIAAGASDVLVELRLTYEISSCSVSRSVTASTYAGFHPFVP